MRLDFEGTVYHLAVKGMTYLGLDGDNNGLVHLVAGNDADAGLTIAPDGNVFNFH